MNSEMRMTRQGLRDLNYYGPKRVPAATTTPASASVTEEPASAPIVAVVAEPLAATTKEE